LSSPCFECRSTASVAGPVGTRPLGLAER
jgi:hypothetical protein